MTLLLGQAMQLVTLTGEVGGINSILFPLFSFIFVVFMAYLAAKFIALKTNRYQSQNNFNIIDQFHLDRHTKLTIVKIVDKVYILGRTESGIEVIDTLDDTRAQEIMDQKQSDKSLNAYLQNQLGHENHIFSSKLMNTIRLKLPFTLSNIKSDKRNSKSHQKNSKDDKNEMD